MNVAPEIRSKISAAQLEVFKDLYDPTQTIHEH